MKIRKIIIIGLIAAAICTMCLTGCSNGEGDSEGSGSGVNTAANGEETAGNGEENAEGSESTPDAAPETIPEESSVESTKTETATEAATATETVTENQAETSVIPEATTASEVTEAPVQTAAPAPEPAGSTAEAVARLAQAQVGVKFNMNHADPVNGFDNSGLVYYVLTQNGITCPRSIGEIAKIGAKVDYNGLQRGDIVVCQMNNSGKADFVGIYIGDGKAVFATSEERPVSAIDITTAWYRNAFLHGCAVAR